MGTKTGSGTSMKWSIVGLITCRDLRAPAQLAQVMWWCYLVTYLTFARHSPPLFRFFCNWSEVHPSRLRERYYLQVQSGRRWLLFMSDQIVTIVSVWELAVKSYNGWWRHYKGIFQFGKVLNNWYLTYFHNAFCNTV